MLLRALTKLLFEGTGIWGLNIPVGWGFAIINFVWWIGIGHAGTLISAILLLVRQEWRTSINRFAEAMTLFAVACAGIFPLIHVGRPWLAYWLLPYPNTMDLWPQFRSPLVWDVFAVSTYATVSLLFWYVGLIPDMATLRDRAQGQFAKIAYGFLCHGLARIGDPLAQLRDGLFAPGGAGYTLGGLGSHGGELRLRGRTASRLARHDLSPLLRRWSHLRRIRDGHHAWPCPCDRCSG